MRKNLNEKEKVKKEEKYGGWGGIILILK